MRCRLRHWLMWAALGVGALLACPTAASAQPGASPSFAAAASRGTQELLGTGDRSPVGWNAKTGLWGGQIPAGWWQSALAVTTIVRYAERTHSTSSTYQRVLLQTYRRNVYGARWQFADPYMDDTTWWALAWLAASQYELWYLHDSHDAARFLSTAEWDARYVAAHPRPCGGIEWSVTTPPDTISNAEFIVLTAELYRYRSTGPFSNPSIAARWLNDAQTSWAWLEGSGLINPQTGSVIDSLNPACQVTGSSLTYTEGEVAEALTQMGNILDNSAFYYGAAASFLNYTISPASGLISNGILQEHCEAVVGACSQVRFPLDLPAFKGLFVNAMSDWEVATGGHQFDGFLHTQASAVIQNAIRGSRNQVAHCTTPQTCQFSFHWTGQPDPAPLGITLGGQESAIDALTATLPARS